MSFFLPLHHCNNLPASQHWSCCCGCTAMTQHYCLCLLRCIVSIIRNLLYLLIIIPYYTYDTTKQTQAIMLRHCSTTTATGPMLRCRQVNAMMQRQEERHRDEQSALQRYEFHFTSIQRTSSVTYFAVRKTTQNNCIS